MLTTKYSLAPALALLLVLATCGKKAEENRASVPPPTKDIDAALGAVPSDALFVISLASPVSFWDLSVNQSLVPLPEEQSKELNAAMNEHVNAHIGLDVRKVKTAVIFGTLAGGAAVIRPVEGVLKGAIDHDGLPMLVLEDDGDLVVALHEESLLVGSKDSVLASVATLQGKSAPFEGDFSSFAKTQIQAAYVGGAAQLDSLPLPPIPFLVGLRRAGLKVDASGIHLTVKGEAATLDMLKAQMQGAIDMGLAILKSEMDASQSEFAIGAGAIMAYYNAKGLASAVEPKVDGETLRIDIDLFGGSMTSTTVVAGIGILAAVAIPAFMKYIKKSKTTEATQFLKKMSDGARMHYMDPPLESPTGDPFAATPRGFPASVGPTPPLGTCCAQGEKCQPHAAQWEHPTWQALDFAIHDPHYFSYEFKTETLDGVETFIAKAYGDLDCDGAYSTFSLYGEIIDGEPVTSGDVIMENALE